MLAGAGVGDLLGGKRGGFLNGAVMLLHDADDLVVEELLLEGLGAVGGADHGKARILCPAVLHHVPADGGAAGVKLVFLDDSVELRNIALLQRRSRAHDGQQIQLQIVQTFLLFLREIRQTFGCGRAAGMLVPGIGREFFQCVRHQETGALFGAAVGLNLQKHLNQKAGGDGQNHQQESQNDFLTEGSVFGIIRTSHRTYS